MAFSLDGSRIWVAGHRGMVGSAITRKLRGYDCEVITVDRADVNLLRQDEVEHFVTREKPDAIILAAARVGGILANATYPAEFLLQNLQIASNVIDAAHRADVDNLVFLGSSCIYPKHASQPIVESSLLEGALEPTNEWYAIAKIAGLKLCEAFHRQYGRNYISAMPCNLYGPGDNYDLNTSHVIPALLRKAHVARLEGASSLSVWGSGNPLREFLHVDDCASGVIHLLEHYSGPQHVNLGSGEEISIKNLATLIVDIVCPNVIIHYDSTKPDGTPRKLMKSDIIRGLGWAPTISLHEGLKKTYILSTQHFER